MKVIFDILFLALLAGCGDPEAAQPHIKPHYPVMQRYTSSIVPVQLNYSTAVNQ